MDCGQFLRTYSEYRDGLADPATRRQAEGHLRTCLRCAHYHSTVHHGVRLLRGLPLLEPSDRFRWGLRGRLATDRSGWPAVGPSARVAAALLIAIATTLLILEGIARSSADRFAARDLPPPVIVVNPGVPFVGFTRTPVTPVFVTDLPDAASRAASVAP